MDFLLIIIAIATKVEKVSLWILNLNPSVSIYIVVSIKEKNTSSDGTFKVFH